MINVYLQQNLYNIGLKKLILKSIKHFFLYSVYNDIMLIQDNLQIDCGISFKRVPEVFTPASYLVYCFYTPFNC